MRGYLAVPAARDLLTKHHGGGIPRAMPPQGAQRRLQRRSDWKCSKCAYSNFAHRLNCHGRECGLHKSSCFGGPADGQRQPSTSTAERQISGQKADEKKARQLKARKRQQAKVKELEAAKKSLEEQLRKKEQSNGADKEGDAAMEVQAAPYPFEYYKSKLEFATKLGAVEEANEC